METRKSKFLRNIILRITISLLLFLAANSSIKAQTQPELQTAVMKMGHIWLGVSANGYRSSFEYLGGFFPNDFDIMADRGQYAEGFAGAGIVMTALHWPNPNLKSKVNPTQDSVENPASYTYQTNLFSNWQVGKVTVPLTNYLRYGIPQQVVNFNTVPLTNFGTVNPSYSGFANHSFDDIAEVTDSTILGMTVSRKLLAWSQNYNDNYVIADLMFTNVSADTLDSVYINLYEGKDNLEYSNGHNPAPATTDNFNMQINWQHYYGAKPGDSLRVFYEYSADDPGKPGDNMGAPALSQGGRLLDPNMTFFSIIHASAVPFTDPSGDIDDPLQPKVTYQGRLFPNQPPNDPYNNSNYYAVRGAFADDNPMPGEYPGTHHELNSDEFGVSDNTQVPAAYPANESYRYVSFGPYNILPGQKVHIVYASGYAGIGFQVGQTVGQQWLDKTLQDPPSAAQTPGWNATTGLLPSNFAFPASDNEIDKRKDRWVSLGIDSVMLSAYRAKWNYDHNYNIPQAPPPPATSTVTGYGDGVEIDWTDPQAESLPNFSGYRIMARVSNADTIFYQPIYDSDANDKGSLHTFKDKNVLFGAQYYFYIQSKALISATDPNADPSTRGKMMYSSRLLYPDIDFVNPPRPNQNDMSKIRIVPNPYNIKDPLLITYGFTNQRNITFYNLPAFCTIKIFTENGDLVQTIQHNDPQKTGSQSWDMLTSSQQVINSGVYIAVFQKPDGELSYQKFVVVR